MTASTPSKHLIVYAEDDADDRDLMVEAFEKYNNQVDLVLFEEGASLLRYLERLELSERHPCLIIVDLNMPVLSGHHVVRSIRSMSRFTNTPVVFFSTSSQNSDQSMAQLHMAGFVTKPLNFRQMSDITERLIDACDQSVRYQIRQSEL